ncbi:UDP-galactopyranose mutase [Secundilactobacillus mixtipabuli]|uniref:UDP-galactopyranose mutase n=1 Tax=Secundilactobacillus mixtipabuli TaxID=1435342 RepID=A0A1Z5IBU4_9LACO|nr:UDP-galactopyranose mutase [Secundilactobacillus mixtipabuli]GAW99212.1 UDP-galactopyranose mutase [Secundilactobacillus mixtipabuli]
MTKYDFSIVGAGLFGSTVAYELAKHGYKVNVIEKRDHIAGNIYTENLDGIIVHKYGAHIFHTNNKGIWEYINQFASFNRYTNSPIANYKGEIYNLPFNMNTFNRMWGVTTPDEARKVIDDQTEKYHIEKPRNLEEQAISLVGPDIYRKLVQGYTEKQWGKKANELPAFIIRRLPIRFTYDNNYFNDMYQGIPNGGYTQIVKKMLDSSLISINLNYDFFENKSTVLNQSNKVVFTGMIDQFFEYSLGELEYRSLKFLTKKVQTNNFQGNAVVNYTDKDVPYTRIIEHKHFDLEGIKRQKNKSIITYEYPIEWHRGIEPYYPVNDQKNNKLYKDYLDLVSKQSKVIFGGRLGMYRYYNMDQTIAAALRLVHRLLDN